jgi:hypothetical protein
MVRGQLQAKSVRIYPKNNLKAKRKGGMVQVVQSSARPGIQTPALLKKQTNEVGAVNKTAKSLKTFVPLLV